MTIAEYREVCMKKFLEKEEKLKERAEQNIEKYRKGTHTLRLLGKDGQPIAGAQVRVKQQSHDFKYGANLFMLDEFEDPVTNARYREQFAQYFNLGTVPFYWSGIEPEEGKLRYAADSPKVYRRPAPDLCLKYCEENGILPKLHCLFYDKIVPKWLTEKNRETVWNLYEKRFADIAQRYSGRMYEFEVTNELISTYMWTTCTKLAYEKDIDIQMWEMGRRYFPQEKLVINDSFPADVGMYSYRSPYFLMIDNLLRKGASVDKIGIQNHIFCGVSGDQEADLKGEIKHLDPDLVIHGLDVLSSFGKPLEITEVTIPTFGDSLEAEQLQADILRVLYTIYFATPLMESVVYWNLADQTAVTEPGWDENACRGGLFHFDMTPKLAALEHKRLFEQEWHTDLELTTDDRGCVTFRGFYGNYVAELGNESFQFGIHKGDLSQTNCSILRGE